MRGGPLRRVGRLKAREANMSGAVGRATGCGRLFLALLIWQILVCAGAAEEVRGECYRFIYNSSDFPATEVESFASESEPLCRELKATLGVQRNEPIPVYLRPGQGVSSTIPYRNQAMDLYYMRPINGVPAPLVHETTHILVDSPHLVLREGLATVMEERIGSLKAHPTYGFTLEDWMGAIQCAGRQVSLSYLETRDWREGPWEANLIAYTTSGSFVKFLIERYGLDAVVKAMQWNWKGRKPTMDRVCELVFNEPLESVEKAWREEMERVGLTSGARGMCQALREGRLQEFLAERLRLP